MENVTLTSAPRLTRHEIIAKCYSEMYEKVYRFISSSVNDSYDAENLTQDVWVRLLEWDKEIDPDGVKSVVYTVARNLVNDYLRRLYRTRNVEADLMGELSDIDSSLESEIIANDLATRELERVECLPRQRRIIYQMSRYDGIPVPESSDMLNLSVRTVENHLRMGRKDIRDFMSSVA